VTLRGAARRRPGLTLLEVLLALAIFLMSLAAISQLVSSAGQRALDARRTEEAARLARSKFAEVSAGAVPLESSEDTPFDEDPDYSWSMTADEGTLENMWVVSVTVKRKGDDGPGFTLREFMLDPSVRGSTQDSVVITGSTSSPTGTGNSTGSSPSQGSSMPAMSGAAMPASKGGAPKAAAPVAPKMSAPVMPSNPGKAGMAPTNSSAGKK
jgi:prepilin-type N-terminal cleavage/methylation domain-containing protein